MFLTSVLGLVVGLNTIFFLVKMSLVAVLKLVTVQASVFISGLVSVRPCTVLTPVLQEGCATGRYDYIQDE